MLNFSSILENIRMALRALTANKLRAMLTMLGIIIGVAAVITLLSVGRGVERFIGDAFGALGTDLLFVLPGSPDQTSSGPPTQVLQGNVAIGPALTVKDVAALKDPLRVPDAAIIAPEVRTVASVAVGADVIQPFVSGVESDYTIARSWNVVDGRFISDSDLATRARVAVIGQSVVKELFADGRSPLDETIRINRLPYRVIGVLEGKGGSLFGDVDNQVFVPLTAMHNDFFPIRNRAGDLVVSFMYVLPVAGYDRAALTEQITSVLRDQHNIAYRNDDDFSVYSQADFLAAFGAIIGAVTVFLSAIAGISLVVGGIGIMNIMLVTVTERTHEIGLRKAIGAKRRDILFQFLIEAMTLSLLGGLIGIAIGTGGALAIGKLVDNFKPTVQAGSILLATGFSLAVGLFFGLYPALRASRLNPIDALRYE
jgi:putative ABC transport system permease protein